MSPGPAAPGVGATWEDAWPLDGMRTRFAGFNGALESASPIDLGIKAARAALARFDAYMLTRDIALYAGVRMETPAHPARRVCGVGIAVLMQAADATAHRGAGVALCVGT